MSSGSTSSSQRVWTCSFSISGRAANARCSGKLVARQRAIKVGPIAGDDYAVLDGLKAGERVVTSGAQKLADNAPIQPAP